MAPAETLLAVLAQMRPEGGALELNILKLHNLFYQASQKPEFKALLAEFSFDTRDVEAVSPDLESALFSLQLGSYLESSGLHSNRYFINKNATTYYEWNIKRNLSQDQCRTIDDFTGYVKKSLNQNKL